jgi:1-acyl-sn-glycerol-3-phosphate acyltransferase
LAANALMRWLCRLNDTVFVSRSDRAKVPEQVEQVRSAIQETGALTIFPEGATHGGSEPAAFKSSLLSALAPLPDGISVQPLWLDYGADRPHVAWVGEETGLASYLKLTARKRPIALTPHVLPPLTGEALANRKKIAAAARDAIIAARERQGAVRS